MPSPSTLPCLALLLCLEWAVPAQIHVPSVPAPGDVLARFDLVGGTVQSLALPLHSSSPISVRLSLGGVDRTLWLAPHDIRSPNYRLLLDDGTTLRRVPTPAPATFRGTVGGLAGAEVAATVVDGQLWATIHTVDETWGVEPLTSRDRNMPRECHVVYRSSDRAGLDVHCGVDTHDVDKAPPAQPGPSALRVAELAIDADLAFYRYYNNDPVAVERAVTSVINSCNVIYRRDCEIEFVIPTIIVRTTNVYSWNGDLCNLLGQFRTRWNNNHRNVTRDLAHLFTGEGTFSGVVGCAYVGVVCGNSGYGASKAYSGLVTNVGLVSHEVGHNWNAPHCDAQGTCNIMCSGLGGCSNNITSFEAYSANIIVAHKNSRTCLGSPTAPTLTAVSPNTVTSWAPQQVTLTGTLMETVTTVTVAGVPVNFVASSPTTLVFTPRTPFAIATHPVVVSNSSGSSAPLNLTVIGNDPPVLELSPILLRNFPLPLGLHSNPGWVGLPFLSFSNTPSVAPGVIDLGIGNNFTDLIQLGFLVAGSNGAASYGLSMPLETPPGLIVFTQLLAFDPTSITLPLATSNVVRSEVR
ncbi:MAG: M12 family metallo-peptidase [Planctomycetota bacterium]